MTPDQIIAAVVSRIGPATEWNLCDPFALVKAWRAVLSAASVIPSAPDADDIAWAKEAFARDEEKRKMIDGYPAQRARADRLAVALRGLSIACDMTDAAADDPSGSAMDEASAFYAAAKVHAATALAQEQA